MLWVGTYDCICEHPAEPYTSAGSLGGVRVNKEVLAYLLSQRARMRSRLAMLRSGKAWASEMYNGEQVDTTAQTLAELEDNLEEIDRILARSGVTPDTAR